MNTLSKKDKRVVAVVGATRHTGRSGVAVVASMAFYGGLADMMVTAALKDWNSADSVEIMMGLDGWHPTRGTRNTIDRIGQNPAPRMIITDGKFTPLLAVPAQKDWRF